MPNYRRAFVPGGCWFFTVNLLDRRQTLLVDQIETLRAAVAATRQSHAFTIDAIVVLPDHLHTIWEPACRRFRLFDALAVNQESFRQSIAEARIPERGSSCA